jgi:chromate transporter
VNEIALLFAGGLIVMVGTNLRRLRKPVIGIFLVPHFAGLNTFASSVSVLTSFSLSLLFLTFLKIGAVLYGSGYVLLAFLHADFVVRLGWLTDQQLMDAIAIGQVTPGPLFTTATFIGFILGGIPGALVATLGIFLPSFLFVAVSNPLIPRMRNSAWVGGLLEGVNVASLGLMAAVAWLLGRASVTDPLTILVALISLVLLFRFRINSTWLIVGGALMGLLSKVLR